MPKMVTDFREVQNRAFPNTLQNDKWLLTFSNIPGLPDMSEMRYFDAYIKSFTIPDYSLDMMNVEVFGFSIRHPIGGVKANTNLGKLQIEFKVSEDMLNYLTIFKWMRDIRYGEITQQHPDDLLRLYACKVATVTMMDNKKRPIANLRFTKLLPESLSSLPLVMGNSDEVTFSVSFSYEEIEYDLKDPMIGGINPSAPELVSPCGMVAQPLDVSPVWSD